MKANAYGHGSVRVAQALRSVGVDMFAVATVAEGVRLREGGITEPIIMLAQPPISSVGTLVEHRIMPAVYDLEFLGRLSEEALAQGTKARYHLAIDTGMDRIGVAPDCAAEFMRMADKLLGVEVDGTFTHFATADRITDWDFTVQARRFQNAVASICAAGIDPGIVHCANTPTTVLHPEYHFDMVRVGVGLYGLHPADTTRDKLELTQAMSVRARVTRAVQPNVGEGVGYGNICMDQCMFEVPPELAAGADGFKPVEEGDVVTLVGSDGDEFVSIEELAEKMGTINYEVACLFDIRLPKVYV